MKPRVPSVVLFLFVMVMVVFASRGGGHDALAADESPASVGAVISVPSQSATVNLIRNSQFDDAAMNVWILKGQGTRRDPAGGMEGDAAIVMHGATDASELVQDVGSTLQPGARYALGAWVKALSSGTSATIGLRYPGGFPRAFRGIEPGDGWTRVEFVFEAPSGVEWRQIVLGGQGDLLWDSVTLVPADSLEARLAGEWESRLRDGDEVYTGLVVNGLGTGLERGMSPKIYDEEGRLLFAGVGASDTRMFAQGLVAYSRELQEGAAHPRLRVSDVYPLSLPLVVEAKEARGFPATDVVVYQEDAERIKQAVAQFDFLGRFAIVFVVDPFAGL